MPRSETLGPRPAEETSGHGPGARSNEAAKSRVANSAAGRTATQENRGAKRRRRLFSAEYKLDILRRVDACTERGEIGELLRREGLYFSHLTKWRRERKRGALEALRGKRPGPKTVADKELVERLVQIEEEVRILRCRLERAERRLAHRQASLHETPRLVSQPVRDN